MDMQDRNVIDTIQSKYNALKDELDERARRLWGAAEANALGFGGIGTVSKATGMAESTLRIGRRELKSGQLESSTGSVTEEGGRIRCPGGGRKRLTARDRSLLETLDDLVEPTSRGDPTSPLRWTCKSTYAGPVKALAILSQR